MTHSLTDRGRIGAKNNINVDSKYDREKDKEVGTKDFSVRSPVLSVPCIFTQN